MSRLTPEREASLRLWASFLTSPTWQQRAIAGELLAEIDALRAEVAVKDDLLSTLARQDAEKIVQLQQQLKAAKDEMTDWILVADGVKHDWRCVNGEAGTARCLRCQLEAAREQIAQLVKASRPDTSVPAARGLSGVVALAKEQGRQDGIAEAIAAVSGSLSYNEWNRAVIDRAATVEALEALRAPQAAAEPVPAETFEPMPVSTTHHGPNRTCSSCDSPDFICSGCITVTHCEHHGRCLAECVPVVTLHSPKPEALRRKP